MKQSHLGPKKQIQIHSYSYYTETAVKHITVSKKTEHSVNFLTSTDKEACNQDVLISQDVIQYVNERESGIYKTFIYGV